MMITEIKRIGNGQRYSVNLDESRKIVLEAEVIARHKLKTGDEIDEDQLTSILLENGDLSAFDRALTYLEKNIKTEKGIKDYLSQKSFLPESIEKAVFKLKEYGYIDDRIYAENYIRTYMSRKGKRLLKMELISKGVDKGLAEEVLCDLLSEDDEIISCKQIFNKYTKNKQMDLKARQKAYAYLAGKGFSSEIIARTMREAECELE